MWASMIALSVASIWPSLLRSAAVKNGSQRILNAVVNGTLPAGVSANAPEAGSAYDYILLLDGVGMGQSSYGRVSPYAVSRDVNDPQPYGIYDVTFQFDIRNEGGSVKRTGAIDHKIVIYNDFGLPGLLSTVMGASRQRADYQRTRMRSGMHTLQRLKRAMRSHRATRSQQDVCRPRPIRMAPTTPIRRLWTPLTRR